MIANHHTLNMAYNGHHFARIKFPDLEPYAVVREKADYIMKAILSFHEEKLFEPNKWSFTLTRVECSGYQEEL